MKSAPRSFAAAPTCARCAKAVYMAEQTTGPGGFWHKQCLTCKECNRKLDSTNLTERSNEAYCKTCYAKLFGPKGFGFAQHTLDSTITDEQRFFPKDAPPQPSYAPSSDAGRISGAASEPPAPVLPSAVRTAAMFEAKAKLASAAVAAGGCPKCGKQVYFAEQIIGPGGVKYHKTCFRCTDCGKGLDATTLAEKDNVLFCKTCHTKKFGPKGYGFGVGAGTLAFTQ